VNSDNDYGNNGMAIFLKTAQEEGICVEYSVKFYRTEPEKLNQVVHTIERGTAKVIVAFVSFVEMGLLIEQLSIQKITGLQMIGVEPWITAMTYITPNSFHTMGGSLGFAVRKIDIDGFAEYVMKEFWDTAFPCSESDGNYSQYESSCSRYEDLLALKNYNEDVTEHRYSSNVYKAIYAVAHSLHRLFKCKKQEGCEKGLTIQPQQVHDKRLMHRKGENGNNVLKCPNSFLFFYFFGKVVEALKRIHFTIKTGDHVWFDKTGGVVALYEVVNWQQTSNGSFELQSVGYYDASLPPNQNLDLSIEKIIWAGGQLKVNCNNLFVIVFV